ncbi:spore germination protein [Sporosarcina trichiuri]|uniref:spore germination protein n=1 Tax=Sporosarcina trichiuri TaxID=3056445 RepID=UPI0025B5B349|nr:spore germination protein [Sporosarcina sp. 0.2-SM1T-5]WJY27397.1 spore germination protein [Sporosarcina sp. 0.2-SM1T-5]
MADSKQQTMPKFMKTLTDALPKSYDVLHVPLSSNGQSAQLLYLKTVVDGAVLQETIIKPFFETADERMFAAYLRGMPNRIDLPSTEEVLTMLTAGFVLAYTDGAYSFLEVRRLGNTDQLETIKEATIHGPQLALSEDLETNISIIRQHYHSPSLYIETHQLNDKSRMAIALLYDEKEVDIEVLRRVKERLDALDEPLIQSSGDLAIRLTRRRFSLFPQSIVTERPDRIVYNLTGGKIVLLVDNSPFGIVLPIVFFDLMVSMEENYHTYFVSLFNTLLGWFGLFTCLLLPAFYVAITAFSPGILGTELTLSIAGSRIGVPYPSFIEALIMLLFVELLTEASVRLPKTINAAATTVGGLILGTAATEASLASNILIIVVAIVAISTFVIPNNELSFTVRLCRVFLIFFTTLFGMVGLVSGFLLLILHLTNLDSFGKPYLRIGWRSKRSEKQVSSE